MDTNSLARNRHYVTWFCIGFVGADPERRLRMIEIFHAAFQAATPTEQRMMRLAVHLFFNRGSAYFRWLAADLERRHGRKPVQNSQTFGRLCAAADIHPFTVAQYAC
jgi:hypothetical protein